MYWLKLQVPQNELSPQGDFSRNTVRWAFQTAMSQQLPSHVVHEQHAAEGRQVSWEFLPL